MRFAKIKIGMNKRNFWSAQKLEINSGAILKEAEYSRISLGFLCCYHNQTTCRQYPRCYGFDKRGDKNLYYHSFLLNRFELPPEIYFPLPPFQILMVGSMGTFVTN